MPKISRYISRERVTPTPFPRVSPEYMAQGVGGAAKLAAETFGVAAKIIQARENSELMRVQNSWRQGVNDYLVDLDTDTDYATYNERFEKFQKKLQGIIKTNYKGNVKAFDNFVERELVLNRYAVNSKASRGEIRAMEGQYFEDLVMATKRLDKDFIEESTDTAIESGYLDPVKGVKAREQALAEVGRLEHKIEYQDAWQDVLAAPDREAAMDIIKEAPLEVGEKNALIVAYDRETKFQEAQEEERKNEIITEAQDDFITRAYDVDNPLTHSEIDSSALEPTGGGSKAFFHNLIDKRAEAILKDERSPFEVTDPKVLAKLLLRENDPNVPPLSATEILSLVGDGIGVGTAQSLVKTLDVRNSDVFKNTEAFLKFRFGYEGILKGFGDKPIGALFYNSAMTEILTNLAATPLKGAELRDKMYELSKPYLEQYWDAADKDVDDLDELLGLMGVKSSPASKLLPPESAPKEYDMEYVPGKGWVK